MAPKWKQSKLSVTFMSIDILELMCTNSTLEIRYCFSFIAERKILLVPSIHRDAGKQVEILNKDGQPKLCPSIQNYPLGLRVNKYVTNC